MLVFADERALAWVLREGSMAFPGRLRKHLAQLKAGDNLLLYTTSRCFRPPLPGQFIGTATARTEVAPRPCALTIAERRFELGCELRVEQMTPLGQGLPLGPLVSQLDAFPDTEGWRFSLMRSLVPLPEGDVSFILEELESRLQPSERVIGEYLSRTS